jgi:hypothetical protein
MTEQGGGSSKVFRQFCLSKVIANFLFFFCFRKLQQTVPVDEFLYESNVSRKEKNKIDSLFLNHVMLFIDLIGGLGRIREKFKFVIAIFVRLFTGW